MCFATGISLNNKGVFGLFIFAREHNFHGLFGNVRIKLHLPLMRPQGNKVKVVGEEPLARFNIGDFYEK